MSKKKKNKRQKKQKKAKQARFQEAKRKREAELNEKARREAMPKPPEPPKPPKPPKLFKSSKSKVKSEDDLFGSVLKSLLGEPDRSNSAPLDPHLAALNKRYDEFEAEKDYEARIALFLKTMDEGLMDEENAFHMLSEINDQSLKYGNEGRERVNSLIALLRERLPDIYEEDSPYYLTWLATNAFSTNKLDSLADIADQVAKIAGKDLEYFQHIVSQFAYYDQLPLVVHMMRQGFPYVKEKADQYFYNVVGEFAAKAIIYEILAYIETNPTGDITDPLLRERILYYQQDDFEWDKIGQMLEHVSGQASYQWTLTDFGLQKDPSGAKYDFDAHNRLSLFHFTMEFVHYLHKTEGISSSKGQQAQDAIKNYLLKRQEGKLKPTPNIFERPKRGKQKRKRKKRTHEHDHFFVPDRKTLDYYFTDLMNEDRPQIYSIVSTYETLPAWLCYLELHNLIDSERRGQALDELAGMKIHLLKKLDEYTTDFALLKNTKNWW